MAVPAVPVVLAANVGQQFFYSLGSRLRSIARLAVANWGVIGIVRGFGTGALTPVRFVLGAACMIGRALNSICLRIRLIYMQRDGKEEEANHGTRVRTHSEQDELGFENRHGMVHVDTQTAANQRGNQPTSNRGQSRRDQARPTNPPLPPPRLPLLSRPPPWLALPQRPCASSFRQTHVVVRSAAWSPSPGSQLPSAAWWRR